MSDKFIDFRGCTIHNQETKQSYVIGEVNGGVVAVLDASNHKKVGFFPIDVLEMPHWKIVA